MSMSSGKSQVSMAVHGPLETQHTTSGHGDSKGPARPMHSRIGMARHATLVWLRKAPGKHMHVVGTNGIL